MGVADGAKPFWKFGEFVLFPYLSKALNTIKQRDRLNGVCFVEQPRNDKGFTMPEVLVASAIAIVITVAVTAAVMGAIGIIANIEGTAIRTTLPLSISQQIASEVEEADIIVPINPATNGNTGTSLYFNTRLDFIKSSGEDQCEYHSYFLKTLDVNERTAELRHFVKAFSFNKNILNLASYNDTFSCMSYYKTMHTQSTEGLEACQNRENLSVGDAVNNVRGERCEILLEKISAEEAVFRYLNIDGSTIPQIDDEVPSSAPGYGLLSSGIFAASVGPKCQLDIELAASENATDNWHAPGNNLDLVSIRLKIPNSSRVNVWASDVIESSATPQYVKLGGRAC